MAKYCNECGRSIGTLFDEPSSLAKYCQPKCKQKAYRRRLKEREAVTAEQRRYGYLRTGSIEHISKLLDGFGSDRGNV